MNTKDHPPFYGTTRRPYQLVRERIENNMVALKTNPDTAPTTPGKPKTTPKAVGTAVVKTETRALTTEEMNAEFEASKIEGALEQKDVIKLRKDFALAAHKMGENAYKLRTAGNFLNDPESGVHHVNTFKEYCDKVLMTTEADVSRKIHHYEVVTFLPAGFQPALESQSRELIHVPKERWLETMQSAITMATELKKSAGDKLPLTAKLIQDAAQPFIPEDKRVKVATRTAKTAQTQGKPPKGTTEATEVPTSSLPTLPTETTSEEEILPGFTLSDIAVYLGKEEVILEGYGDLFKLKLEYPNEGIKEIYVFIRPQVQSTIPEVASEGEAAATDESGTTDANPFEG